MESITRPPDPADATSTTDPMWVRLLFKYGIPGALCLYLVYMMTATFSGKLDAMGDDLHAHSSLSLLTNQDLKESAVRQEVYLRLLCVNTAKNDEARNRCLTVR